MKNKRITSVKWGSCCDNPDGWSLYTIVTFGKEYEEWTEKQMVEEIEFIKEAITGEAYEKK